MRKVGRPKKNLLIDTLRAKAWFNSVARLAAGAPTIFSFEPAPLQARLIDKFLGSAAEEGRLASKWRRGNCCPNETNRTLLYQNLGWMKLNISKHGGVEKRRTGIHSNPRAAAEICLLCGPDGSNLWDVLQDPKKIDDSPAGFASLINPKMEVGKYSDISKCDYSSQLAIPLLTLMIANSKREYQSLMFGYYSEIMLQNCNSCNSIESESLLSSDIKPEALIILSDDFITDCEERLSWYGLSLESVLDAAGLKKEI